MDHERLLRRTIELASANVRDRRGGPFGALVSRGDEIIAEGVNLVTATNDPTAHAEIVAIRAACAALGSFQLSGCVVYASCEPCPMCLGAVFWARPGAIYYAATREDAAAAGFDDSLIYGQLPLPGALRIIPSSHIEIPGSRIPFEDWLRSPLRTAY